MKFSVEIAKSVRAKGRIEIEAETYAEAINEAMDSCESINYDIDETTTYNVLGARTRLSELATKRND